MKKDKYIADIEEIKKIMNRSSKFLSLSGLSGIISGILALVAAYVVDRFIYQNLDLSQFHKIIMSFQELVLLICIAIATIVLSMSLGILLTTRKARRLNQSVFDEHARLLMTSFSIPMTTGGLICLIILLKGGLVLVAPLTLVFYGLALVSASKYAVPSMFYLGLLEVGIGLLSLLWLDYSLIFWGFGFGVMHVVYGIFMYINDPS